jgi:hypothetical protein
MDRRKTEQRDELKIYKLIKDDKFNGNVIELTVQYIPFKVLTKECVEVERY